MSIREGIDKLLTEELVMKQFTHENCPPTEYAEVHSLDCKLKTDIKHRECMVCWGEFVDELNVKLIEFLKSQGVVQKVDYYVSGTEVNCPQCHCSFLDNVVEL